MTIRSPVMRYFGGKFRLAPWIISFFPEHKKYIEPYGGGASVLMRKERSYSEVYNDIDDTIVNVFRVLRDPVLARELEKVCYLTPYSRTEYQLSTIKCGDKLEQARRTLFMAAAGFGAFTCSDSGTGFRSDSDRKYQLCSHVWAKYPDNIRHFCDRLSGVLIENKPALDVIDRHANEDSLIYLDPPYVHETRVMKGGRGYAYEMTNEDHVKLLDKIKCIPGMVVLSGYDNKLYRSYLTGWEKHTTRSRKSGQKGTKISEECIWINPECVQKLKYPKLI